MTLLVMRILLLTAEALAVSTLLPLLAFVVTPFFRGRAAQRHLFWLVTFAVLLALPLLALLLPGQVVTLEPAPSVPVVVTMAAPVTAAYAHSWSLDSIIAALFAPLCLLWFAGMLFHLSRLGLGAFALHRLKARSEAFADGIVLGDGGPLTFGWLRPVILLPRAAPAWPRERLEAVLRHERAHIRRHDSLTQMLANLACAFYWPNPLVWVAARRLRRDAEIAADDMVLASGVQASAYATELVQMAAEFAGRPRLMAVAMATPSTLEARVTSVLSPTPSRQGATRMDALKLAALGGVAAFALAMARPDLALAQVTSRPLPPPVADQDTAKADADQQAIDREVARADRADAVRAHRHPVQDVPPVPPMPPVRAVDAAPPMPPAPPHAVRVVVHPAPAEVDAMVERARVRADAAMERAREATERELAPDRMERIVADTQRRVAQAARRYDEAMRRVLKRQDGDEEVREDVRQSLVDGRPDTARIVAQVRVQVKNAMAEARVSRDVALAQAHAEIEAALAQARAQAHHRVREEDQDR